MAIDPDFAKGVEAQNAGAHGAALLHYERSLQHDLDHVDAHINRGSRNSEV